MTTAAPDQLEALAERLRTDTPFWAKHCAKIVDKRRATVPLLAKGAQLRFDRMLEEQRAAGLPMRGLALKARQVGVSTWTQAKFTQRTTQLANRRALTLAHNHGTAGELFAIGHRIWRNLPEKEELEGIDIKPEIRSERRHRLLHFGTPINDYNELWPDSTLTVDTANEFEAGRGHTYSELHGSEVAFWPDIQRKLMGVLEAVPNEPETLVVLESTANGYNLWKTLWDAAERGENEWAPFFSPWFEEPTYTRPFLNDADRADFEASLDAYERSLLEESPYPAAREEPLTLEQVHWRRHRLSNPPYLGDVLRFQQEMPATPLEAFIASGRMLFDPGLVQRVIRVTDETDPKLATEESPGPEVGVLNMTGSAERKGRHGTVTVPTGVEWKPRSEAGHGSRHPYWRVWEHPVQSDKDTPAGQYVIALDPSAGDETDEGETAYHAIQVVNHRSREQAAEYRSRIDPDLVGVELYLAALYWNHAILAPEVTGGYGLSIASRIYFDFKYPRHLTYMRKRHRDKKETETDALGWDTQRDSKVLIEDGMREMLREGTHGIRSRLLAAEMTTYLKDNRGRTAPEKNAFADLLMAYMIAQQVAQEMRPRPERKPGQVVDMIGTARDRWRR